MKILHLSTNDTSGGAAIAAHRLHSGLREAGIDSKMLVFGKHTPSEHVLSVGPRGGMMDEQMRHMVRQNFVDLNLKDPEGNFSRLRFMGGMSSSTHGYMNPMLSICIG